MLIGFVDFVPFPRLDGVFRIDGKRRVRLMLGGLRVMLVLVSPASREQLQQAGGGACGRRAALSAVVAAHDQQRERSNDWRAQAAHTEAQLERASLATEACELLPLDE
ncbi:uncharacterized [Tachysurus ichikawai]